MRPALLTVSLLLAACAARRVADAPAPAAAPAPATMPRPAPVPESAAAASAPSSAEAFESRIRPLLARTCTPCHVPGGKMYERLPFDNPDVVRSNQASILKRLKVPEDRQALESWLRP
jgi:hypothetical protein